MRGAQDAFAADDVGGQHLGRLRDHPVHADDGGQVVDAVGPADHALDPVPGQHVGFVEAEIRVVLVLGDVGARAGGQVVDHVHAVAARQVQVDEMGADETGASGDQDMHGHSPWTPSLRRCETAVRE